MDSWPVLFILVLHLAQCSVLPTSNGTKSIRASLGQQMQIKLNALRSESTGMPFAKQISVTTQHPVAEQLTSTLDWFQSVNKTQYPMFKALCSDPVVIPVRVVQGVRVQQRNGNLGWDNVRFGFRINANQIIVSDGYRESLKPSRKFVKSFRQQNYPVTREMLRTAKAFAEHFSLVLAGISVSFEATAEGHTNILLRTFENPPVAAVVMRNNSKFLEPILFSEPDKLVECEHRRGDIILVGEYSLIMESLPSINFRATNNAVYVSQRLYSTNTMDRSLLIVVKLES